MSVRKKIGLGNKYFEIVGKVKSMPEFIAEVKKLAASSTSTEKSTEKQPETPKKDVSLQEVEVVFKRKPDEEGFKYTVKGDKIFNAKGVEVYKKANKLLNIKTNFTVHCGMAIGYLEEKSKINSLITEREKVTNFCKFMN